MKELVKDGPVDVWEDDNDGFVTVGFRGITVCFDPEDWNDFAQAITKAAALKSGEDGEDNELDHDKTLQMVELHIEEATGEGRLVQLA